MIQLQCVTRLWTRALSRLEVVSVLQLPELATFRFAGP